MHQGQVSRGPNLYRSTDVDGCNRVCLCVHVSVQSDTKDQAGPLMPPLPHLLCLHSGTEISVLGSEGQRSLGRACTYCHAATCTQFCLGPATSRGFMAVTGLVHLPEGFRGPCCNLVASNPGLSSLGTSLAPWAVVEAAAAGPSCTMTNLEWRWGNNITRSSILTLSPSPLPNAKAPRADPVLVGRRS